MFQAHRHAVTKKEVASSCCRNTNNQQQPQQEPEPNELWTGLESTTNTSTRWKSGGWKQRRREHQGQKRQKSKKCLPKRTEQLPALELENITRRSEVPQNPFVNRILRNICFAGETKKKYVDMKAWLGWRRCSTRNSQTRNVRPGWAKPNSFAHRVQNRRNKITLVK
jgi:hypothetical protein